MNQNNNRRSFIRNASFGTIAAISIPQIVSSALSCRAEGKRVTIEKGDTILFQGDSITDSGRGSRNALMPNNAGALGNGYALMATRRIIAETP